MGTHYQLYSAVFQEDDFTQIELINANNQSIFIMLDELDNGDPNPVTAYIQYYHLNQNGVLTSLLEEEGFSVSRYSPLIPLYFLLSQSFHQLLNQIILSGKPMSVHLLNPLSPDNSAPFHLMPGQTDNICTVVAHPINSEGLIQYTNSAMLFHHTNQFNWNYYINQNLISSEARLLFYQHKLFELGNTIIAAALLSLFTQKPSLPNR